MEFMKKRIIGTIIKIVHYPQKTRLSLFTSPWLMVLLLSSNVTMQKLLQTSELHATAMPRYQPELTRILEEENLSGFFIRFLYR